MTNEMHENDTRTLISADDFIDMIIEWSDGCEQSFDQVIRQAEIRIKEDHPDRDYVIETFTDEQTLFLFTELSSQMQELIDNERSDWSEFELSDIEGLFNNLQETSDPYSPGEDDAVPSEKEKTTSKKLISADKFIDLVEFWNDGCEEGFDQLVNYVEIRFKEKYGEDKYEIEPFSDANKKILFDIISEQVEEFIADEDCDWHEFELDMIDELFDNLPMAD